MTQYKNQPFIVGDYDNDQIEYMHLSHKVWSSAGQFHNGKHAKIFGYSAVSRPGKVFIFGGCCDHWSDVSIFENDSWLSGGKLANGRMNFITIPYGTDVMIIGGTSENELP